VISSRRRDANRRNARASTGPTSASGKERSAANARWHGLTVPIATDPVRTGQSHALAYVFAGDAHSPEVFKLASLAADAQTQLDRIRRAARDLMSNGVVDEKLVSKLGTFADYERRALSRRNRALQDIDCQRLIESITS
jgi:hypothetical protein